MAKISDVDITSLLFQEGSAPSTPASTKWRLYAKTDGVYYKDDAGVETGPLAASSGSTYYAPPTITNYASAFTSSSTTCGVTVTAPGTSDVLVGIAYSTSRTCNSITQTNVTWTSRYTGNGNSQHITVFTGVASASAGTTATFNFTGSNSQFCEVFTVNSASAFTSVSANNTATAASTALATVSQNAALTVGSHVIFAVCAAGPTSSYPGSSHAYVPLSNFGGQGRGGITRMNATKLSVWSLSSSAVNYFAAILVIS